MDNRQIFDYHLDAIIAEQLIDRAAQWKDAARASELVVVEPDDDLIDVPDYRPPRNVTVTSTPEYRPYRSRLRWVLPVIVVTCLLVGAIWLVMAIVTATISAVAAAAPSIISILGVVALILLLASLGGRGGGRSFSGTFSGRMH